MPPVGDGQRDANPAYLVSDLWQSVVRHARRTADTPPPGLERTNRVGGVGCILWRYLARQCWRFGRGASVSGHGGDTSVGVNCKRVQTQSLLELRALHRPELRSRQIQARKVHQREQNFRDLPAEVKFEEGDEGLS